MQNIPRKRHQQLQAQDRVITASLARQKHSFHALALVLKRSPCTINRELPRNARPTG